MSQGIQTTDLSIRPVVMAWEEVCVGSMMEVWALFSDTDQINRSAGMHHTYEQVVGPDGAVRRIGKLRQLGLTIPFDEEVFDFEAPERFQIVRRFHYGPASRYVVDLTLEPSDGAVIARYVVTTWPRLAALRPIVNWIQKLLVQPGLDRAIGTIVKVLAGECETFSTLPPPLQRDANERLEQGLAKLENAKVAKRLRAFIHEASLREQNRMEPGRLARAWKLPEEDVVDGMLEAAQGDLLHVSWDLLCPSCLGPSAKDARLSLNDEGVHCPSCNIAFDGNYGDALAISFRPTPDIRPLQHRQLCIGAPALTPHMVGRVDIDAHREGVFRLDLKSGVYRIRELSSMASTLVSVGDEHSAHEAVVALGPRGPFPRTLQLGPGSSTISIGSKLERPCRVVCERRWRPSHTVTAGRVLERERSRSLVPEQSLPPELKMDVCEGVGMVTEVFHHREETLTKVREMVEARRPKHVRRVGNSLVSVWDQFNEPIKIAGEFEGASQACSALSVGPIVTLGSSNKPILMGSGLETTYRALRTSIPGRSSVSHEASDRQDFQAYLEMDQNVDGLVGGPELGGFQDFLLKFRRQRGLSLSRFAPAAEEDENLAGTLVETRYRLDRKLGSGGFGSVFLAWDTVAEREVAVKLLHPNHSQDASLVQQFFLEARACSRLKHMNVVPLLDFGHTSGGRLFLVMEALEGQDLSSMMRKRRILSTLEVCRVAVGILRALVATHAAGVIHRDLKPSNIFLLPGSIGPDSVRVLDFGVAYDKEVGNDHEVAGEVLGTVRYMSPEQIRGLPSDARSDLYSLGLVMYRCVTGRMPRAKNMPQDDLPDVVLALRRVHVPLEPVATRCPNHMHPEIGKIIDRTLDIKVEDRFDSAQQMLDELEPLVV